MSASNSILIRLMNAGDLPAVVAIERAAYTTIEPEDVEALGSKLNVAPDTCWVACLEDEVVGYLIALPWSSVALPPALHERTLKLPSQQDALYMHDLALSVKARGHGTGGTLVSQALRYATSLGLRYSTLIAVQNAATYWEKFGYRAVRKLSPEFAAKLASYEASATYMRLEL